MVFKHCTPQERGHRGQRKNSHGRTMGRQNRKKFCGRKHNIQIFATLVTNLTIGTLQVVDNKIIGSWWRALGKWKSDSGTLEVSRNWGVWVVSNTYCVPTTGQAPGHVPYIHYLIYPIKKLANLDLNCILQMEKLICECSLSPVGQQNEPTYLFPTNSFLSPEESESLHLSFYLLIFHCLITPQAIFYHTCIYTSIPFARLCFQSLSSKCCPVTSRRGICP